MKAKFLLFMAFSLCMAGEVNAQSSGMYLRINGGFGFGLTPAVVGADVVNTFTNSTSNTSSTTITPAKFSLGKGIYPEAGIGFMFDDNFGVDLGVGYLIGLSSKITNTNNGTTTQGTSVQTTADDSTATFSFHTFLVTPSIIIKGGSSDDAMIPYARFGLSVSFLSKLKNETKINNALTSNDVNLYGKDTTTSTDQVIETTGSLQFGVSAAAGVMFKLSDNMSFFGEVNVRAFNFRASQALLKTYSINGKDQTSNYNTAQTTTNYVTSITTTNTTTYGNSDPVQALVYTMPASSIGISVGLTINFGGQ